MRWVEHVVAHMDERRNAYSISIGKPRHKWEDNVRIDLGETGWEDVDWFHLAQDRDQWQAPVNTVMNLWVP
jgi:hypothetical protein